MLHFSTWKNLATVSSVAMILFFVAMGANAAPDLMSYQGRLLDELGNPVTTPVRIEFSFHSDPTADAPMPDGTPFYDEDYITPNAEGYYDTVIGDAGSLDIPEVIFMRDAVWLSVVVEGEELLPRKQLTAIGYAMTAKNANRVVLDFEVATGHNIGPGDYVELSASRHVFKSTASASGLISGLSGFTRFTFPIGNDKMLLIMDEYNSTSDKAYLLGLVGATPTVLDEIVVGDIAGGDCVSLDSSNYLVQENSGSCKVLQVGGDTLNLGGAASLDGKMVPLSPTRVLGQSDVEVIDQSTIVDHDALVNLYSISGTNISLIDSATGSLLGSFPGAPGAPYRVGGVSIGTEDALLYYSGDEVIHVNASGDALTVQSIDSVTSIGNVSVAAGGFIEAGVIRNSSNSAFFFPIFFPDGSREITTTVLVSLQGGSIVSQSPQSVPLYPNPDTNTSVHQLFPLDLGNSQIGVCVQEKRPFDEYFHFYYNVYDTSGGVLTKTATVEVETLTANAEHIKDVQSVVWPNGTYSLIYTRENGMADTRKTFVFTYDENEPIPLTGNPLGVAAEAGGGGDRIPIILMGLSDVHSGLVPGRSYYYDETSGFLTLSNTGFYVGRAMSSTELLMDRR